MATEYIQFYKDKAHTTPQMPCTHASAVKWDDTQSLPQKVGKMEEDIANAGKFYGIDTNTILASGSIFPYTAVQDCILCPAMAGSTTILIDNIIIARTGSISGYTCYPISLKKGQVASVGNGHTLSEVTNVYGLK